MEYIDANPIRKDNEYLEVVMGNMTKCFTIWVLLATINIIACFITSKAIGNSWPNLTLFILTTLSTSISLLLLISLSIGCFYRIRKHTLCWKKSIFYSLVGFALTTIIASGLIEFFNTLVNHGIH